MKTWEAIVTSGTRSIKDLINELEKRMRKDYYRMRRWRNWHRIVALLYTFALLILPAVLAVGLYQPETREGKIVALLIAVVGGLNAAFQPMLHSSRRRHDMNESRRLLDAFRAEIVREQEDTQKLVQIFQNYAKLFADMYAARGQRLTDTITHQPDKQQARLT